jgi:hypothetical protein
VNEDGRSGWYADASYLVPQVEIGRYVDAIREGDDARLVDMFVEDFVGRGTLSQQFLARYFVGTDERGNPVYTSPDIADNAEVFLREFFETMKPGTINTIKRFIEAKGDPKKLDAAQLRLLGIRTVPWDEGNLISRMYSTKELANANASDYGARRNAFNRGDITQDELNQAYETQNSIYQKNMAILAQHYENASMEPWNYTIEERREQMKQAGLNARERLAIMMGEIPSLPKDRPLGMREKYDALGGTVQERRKSIGEIAKEDKIEAMKLLRYANQREFQDKQGMGPIELDIKALEPQDKIAFIRSQNPTPQSLKRMRVLGIINDEQLVILGKNSY